MMARTRRRLAFHAKLFRVELSSRQRAFLDLARSLMRLDRTMQGVLERALHEELGLSAREMFVLASLDRGETRPGGVARRLNMAPPSVTRALEALERSGRVRRDRPEHDRRSVRLELTDEGRDVLERARATVSQALADAWPELPTERAADLASGLARLAEGEPAAAAPTTAAADDPEATPESPRDD